jgi:transcriptional regulator GlxA family with amidase domain
MQFVLTPLPRERATPRSGLIEEQRRWVCEAFATQRLSADELAERAQVHPRTIQRVLRGETASPQTLDRLATVLGLDLAVVLT